jgi:DnaK suppressor protein
VTDPARAGHGPGRAKGGKREVNARDLKYFEKRLLEERVRMVRQLGIHHETLTRETQRDSSGDLSAYSFHMADLGSDAMEREKEFLMASAEGRMIRDIDCALRKIHARKYGTCELCGEKIPRERLEIMPQAEMCIRCAENEEKQEKTP